jgi:predicted ArsR family transcriptional regulator
VSATSIPLQSVGRALARIGAVRGPRPGPTASGGDSRAAVLEFIEAADDVVRVEQIAEAVGLHPNTVRGHLDALLASGRITRVPDQRSTRGRPHWLYSGTASASIRELARALDSELDRASAPDVARLAAATWAEAGPDVGPVETLEAAVDQATRVLTDFGFEAVRNPVGDEITLRACPYAELVHEHPVICDIHAELLGEVLARTTQPVTLASLDVFPRPGLCVAHLRRPDVDPEWTVEVQDPGPRARVSRSGSAAGAGTTPSTSRSQAPRTTNKASTQKAATPSPRKKK